MSMRSALPMMLSKEDEQLLLGRIVVRMVREDPGGRFTQEQRWAAIRREAAAMVAEGIFVYYEGVLIRPGSDLKAIVRRRYGDGGPPPRRYPNLS